jgi:hypothetical protein
MANPGQIANFIEAPHPDSNKYEYWKYCKQCFDAICKSYKLVDTEKPDLQDFALLKSKIAAKHMRSWVLRENTHQFTLNLVEYPIFIEEGSKLSMREIKQEDHYYFYGHMHLRKNFGRALIRPETLTDKFNELFERTEIDFDGHKLFSDKYFVQAENVDYFKTSVNSYLLEWMGKTKGIWMEFNGEECLFRLNKAVDAKEAKQLCEYGLQLNRIIGK